MNDTPATNEKAKKPRQSAVSEIYDYLEIFIFAAVAVLLLFTFSIRLCRVDGHSMDHTLENGQMLLVSDVFYKPDTGDILVFHQTDNQRADLNKPLVKRVIATGGEWVFIRYIKDDSGVYRMDVYVSPDDNFEESEKLTEDYIDFVAASSVHSPENYYFPRCTREADGTYTYRAHVPEGRLFVMGDNRYNSTDSRVDVGFVDQRCVLGKVLFRVAPFKMFS